MNNISADGTLYSDNMVRALLMLRNTPDPSCKLSPAEILLGHRLRVSLSFISKDASAFDNPAIAEKWREAWNLKERSLKDRYIRTLETLGEHNRSLDQLQLGDNIRCLFKTKLAKRWNRSGIFMETKGNDQYLVKVSGSGWSLIDNSYENTVA